jgi:hypothetical protein
MSWLKQIIANSLDGNAVRVKEAVANEMNTRIETAKESIRMEVAQKLFGESVEESDAEELDEISQGKALDYYGKAKKDLEGRDKTLSGATAKPLDKKAGNRATGMKTAASKIAGLANVNVTKESEELDEAKSWKDMTDKQLEDWLEKNDTDKPGIGTAYAMQIKAARSELQRRKK